MLSRSQEATWRGEEPASLNGRFGPIKLELEHAYTNSLTHTRCSWSTGLAWPDNTLWIHPPVCPCAHTNTFPFCSTSHRHLSRYSACFIHINTHSYVHTFVPPSHTHTHTAVILSLLSSCNTHICCSTLPTCALYVCPPPHPLFSTVKAD